PSSAPRWCRWSTVDSGPAGKKKPEPADRPIPVLNIGIVVAFGSGPRPRRGWFDPALTPWAGGLGLRSRCRTEPSQATRGCSPRIGAPAWFILGHIVASHHQFKQPVRLRDPAPADRPPLQFAPSR